MQAVLWKLLTLVLNWFLTKGLDRIIQAFKDKKKKQDREQTNETNRQKVEQAIKEDKTDEEISQSLEDALNGSKQ